MFPYFQYNFFRIGPLTIQVWGLMVALGIIAALMLMNRLAKKYYLSADVLFDMTVWIMLAAFIGARVVHILFYDLEYYLLNPSEILKIWEGGASSLGGFIGAAIALIIFARKRHFTLQNFLPYMDVAAVSLWLGWGIGRIGCFLIHDHPGTLSHFMLAVNFPTGARHDLGLYESITGFALFAVFMYLFKRLVSKRWGLVVTFSVMSYAVIRFFLDFLRATDLPHSDVRYGMLTPAQWGMIALMMTLTSFIVFDILKRRKESQKAANSSK